MIPATPKTPKTPRVPATPSKASTASTTSTSRSWGSDSFCASPPLLQRCIDEPAGSICKVCLTERRREITRGQEGFRQAEECRCNIPVDREGGRAESDHGRGGHDARGGVADRWRKDIALHRTRLSRRPRHDRRRHPIQKVDGRHRPQRPSAAHRLLRVDLRGGRPGNDSVHQYRPVVRQLLRLRRQDVFQRVASLDLYRRISSHRHSRQLAAEGGGAVRVTRHRCTARHADDGDAAVHGEVLLPLVSLTNSAANHVYISSCDSIFCRRDGYAVVKKWDCGISM
jgi:hypothetical protein